MRDIYTESVIPIQPKSYEWILKNIVIVLFVISAISSFFVGLIGLVLTVVTFSLLWLVWQKTDSEYDYVHTNDVFDIDLVVKGARRKTLVTISLDCVVLVAPYRSDERILYSDVSTVDYSGNATEGSLYGMLYAEDGKKNLLLLNMDNKMKESLKKWMPEKVR